jgi:hypothetical protein
MMYKWFMVILLHYITSLHSLTWNINVVKTATEKKNNWKFGKEAFSAYFKV